MTESASDRLEQAQPRIPGPGYPVRALICEIATLSDAQVDTPCHDLRMGRVIGWIFGLLVLFAIITNPTQAAGTTTYLLSGVASAGQQVIYFFQSLVVTTPSDTTPSSTTYYPVGGVETGDGSYPLDDEQLPARSPVAGVK